MHPGVRDIFQDWRAWRAFRKNFELKNHTTKRRKYAVFTVYDLKHFQRKREIGTETERTEK